MPLFQRSTETGIEFINQDGVPIAGIRDDGVFWGSGAPAAAGVAAQGPKGDKGDPGPAGPGVQPQAVQITPPKDLASAVAATRAIINVLNEAGITV
jgi:hypothetical protein